MNKKKKKLEKLISSGKESIIASAIDHLKEREFTPFIFPEEYDISVWTNSKKLLVKFRRLLKYVPTGSNYDYDFIVNMLTKGILPFDDIFSYDKDSFYKPGEDDQKKIDFIKNHTGLPIKGFENYVYEEEECYRVSIKNKYAFRKFQIDKVTAKIFAELEGSFTTQPDDLFEKEIDPLKEIY